VRQQVIGEPPKPTYNVAPKRAEIGRCMSDIALEDAGVYSTLKAAATVLVLPTMSTMHHLASRS